ALGTRLKQAVNSGQIELIRSFTITRLTTPTTGRVQITGTTPQGEQTITADTIVAATGFRPDLNMLREVRTDLDPATEAPIKLAPLIDPNFHSCGTVPPHGERDLAHPETGLYITGMKSYGRAPTFLMATGYEQVRSITAALAGDRTAADTVQLDLPETGVCSTDLAAEGAAAAEEGGSACCGSGAPQPVRRG
ncbi:flavoprotein, partial [Spirillospora sp. NPDC029432]